MPDHNPEADSPPEPGALEDVLSHLQCLLVARRTRANPEGVTWLQYDALELLRIRGVMTPSALSVALGVSRPTTSKALRVLKDLSLIDQRATTDDHRELTTSLSTQGRAFLARVADQRRDNALIAASALSTEEHATFVDLCAKVVAALESDMPDTSLR